MRTLSLFLLIMLQTQFAQQKYLIYFSDKIPDKIIAKESASYHDALSLLSERSIERRKKVMGDEFVRLEDLPVKKEYIQYLSDNGIIVINTLNWFNAVSAYLTEIQVSLLNKLPFINKIEPVRTLRYKKPEIKLVLQKQNADSSFYGVSYTQLGLSDIPQVHTRGITGSGVLLGVLDTGFRWRFHESLRHIDVLGEHDFIFNDNITENESGDNITQHNHGTAVLSIIGGYKDSILIGAAYNASFMLAKTEDVRSETRVEEDNYAAALEWMENQGVDITTNSLGYSEFDGFSYTYEDMDGKTTIVTKAAELAFQRGVLTISSAGNEGLQPWFFITAPADGINTIAVGAVDNKNRVASFSSRGPSSDGRIKPDITAMGVSVYGASAFQNDQYGASSGTSLSAPIAAGSAVLLLSAHSYLTNVQMRDIIIRTADNYLSPDNERGYGLISAANSIEFPNLRFDNGNYFINKIFLDNEVTGARLFISGNNKDFNEISAVRDTLRFTYRVPQYSTNQVINFYIKYPGLSGDTLKLPESGYYSFNYGEMIIRQVNQRDLNYKLSNNYPNPFNNTTRISFFADRPSNVQLVIYDALGRRVKTLFNSAVSGGEYLVRWDGRDDDGNYCSSGVYIYQLKLNDNSESKKMILLK